VKVTEAERKPRSKVARELAIAAQHLRHYREPIWPARSTRWPTASTPVRSPIGRCSKRPALLDET
jgi:hypothetical protein